MNTVGEASRLPAGSLVLGIETCCDETAVAVVRDGTEVLSSVVSARSTCTPRYGGVVPEIASRAHIELLVPVTAQALVEAGVAGSEIDGSGRHHRPGTGRRPAGRSIGRQGVRARVGRALRGGQPPRGPPLRGAARGTRARVPAGGAARLRRPHHAGGDGRSRRVPGAGRDPRRRGGRGLRQGRPLPRPRLPGWPGDRQRGTRW